MDHSSNTVFTKKFLPAQNHLPFQLFQQPSFSYYVIKTIPSDAESCEEQGSGKQKFLGGTTAKLWPIFCQGLAEEK